MLLSGGAHFACAGAPCVCCRGLLSLSCNPVELVCMHLTGETRQTHSSWLVRVGVVGGCVEKPRESENSETVVC
jgi:hypothetical protein